MTKVEEQILKNQIVIMGMLQDLETVWMKIRNIDETYNLIIADRNNEMHDLDIEEIANKIIQTVEEDLKKMETEDTTQRVTRRGIKINGKWFWNDNLIHGYLGRDVNVTISNMEVLVKTKSGELIATFNKSMGE